MRFQITVDCVNPSRMADFWAEALGYQVPDPPEGFESWRDFWIDAGEPPDEIGDGYDSLIDPRGQGPRIWFQKVPERKTIKNRMHFDVLVGGGRQVPLDDRRIRVLAEVERLAELGATQLRIMDHSEHGHFAVAMADPEGNEFDVV